MRNVVLFSGGIDSTVCLSLACWRDGADQTMALGIGYGQHHINELQHARRIATLVGCPYVQAMVDPSPWKLLPLLTGTTAQDRDHYAMRTGGISDAFLPGRNVAFLSIGLAIAGIQGATRIWIGANRDDNAGFPDCRPLFMQAWAAMASAALDRPITLEAPLLELDKRQVVQLGRAMAIDFRQTWSCYRPHTSVRGLDPCGRCDACVLRQDALNPNGP